MSEERRRQQTIAMFAPGARLGGYEILSAIGAGGMGEVYRARDARLGRDVAIKVLPDVFGNDPDRVARFEREAKVVASLNHPNIATIHGFEESDGVRALILELVEGETLREVIARGRLQLPDALAIARQIADALEAAHDKGIVHRDLKPDNIKITHEGKVKVLDFGLAKMLEPEPAQSPSFAGTMSPTLSIHATYGGVILGTAAYMSPEQARGKPVDRRTDIWSFGCVLFEMLTGKQTFDPGETISDAVAHILTREPDWNALPPETPGHIRTLLRRCLQKDPSKRLPHIGLVRLEIDEGSSASEPAPAVATLVPQRLWNKTRVALAVLVGLALVAVSIAATWAMLRSTPPVPQPVRFSITTPAALPFNPNTFYRNLAISPDGTRVVYVSTNAGVTQLATRAIDQLEAVPLRGTISASSPFVSPDDRWVGFFSEGASGELRKVSMSGGSPLPLCRYVGTPRGATWGPDQTIVFATNDGATGLLSVPAGGGEPKVLTKPDASRGEQDHLFPSMLPNGRAVLFTIAPTTGIVNESQIGLLDLTSGKTKTLIRGGGHAMYVDPGFLVYASSGSLRAVRFDLDRLSVLDDPVPVVDQVRTMGTTAAGVFDISRNGTLVFMPGGSNAVMGVQRSLVWVDRHGREEAINAPSRSYAIPRLSPDGQRVALDVRDSENDIWIWDLQRQTLGKFTFNPGADNAPVWTPDGKRLVFGSARGGTGAQNLYWQAADNTGTAERLTTSPNAQIPASFSPDGKSLLMQDNVPSASGDVMLLPMEGAVTGPSTGKLQPRPLVHSPASETNPEVSPDGHWLAYSSTESGQSQVYVRPFPNVESGKWQISTDVGQKPAWSKDGRELFYVTGGLNGFAMMAVPIHTTPTFSADKPVKLFEGRWFTGQVSRTYDVAKDGRFLMIKDVTLDQGATAPAFTVVVNWVEELKQRLAK